MKALNTALTLTFAGFLLCCLGAALNGCKGRPEAVQQVDGFVPVSPEKHLPGGIVRAQLWQPIGKLGIGNPVYQRDADNRGFVRVGILTEQD